MCARVLEQSGARVHVHGVNYTQRIVLGTFPPALPHWEPWLLVSRADTGRGGGGWWGVIEAVGAPSHRWTGSTTYADRTLCVSFHFSVLSPARAHRAPEWNINHPNSIYGSQSYFLDEQCRHFCVIDDEHVGTVQCSHSNEVRAGNKSFVGSVCWAPSQIEDLCKKKKKKEPQILCKGHG